MPLVLKVTDAEVVLYVYTDGDTWQLREDFDAVVITQMIADLLGGANDPKFRVVFERCHESAQISIRAPLSLCVQGRNVIEPAPCTSG